MPLVFGAAFEIVDGIGGLRESFGGIGELLLDLCSWTCEQTIGSVGLGRHSAYAADDGGRLFNLSAVYF